MSSGLPNNHRTALNDLVQRYHLSVQCTVELDESRGIWRATYRLVMSEGSDPIDLGSGSGTSRSLAREEAAYQSLSNLTALLAARGDSTHGSSGNG
jgi:hypothetical protein